MATAASVILGERVRAMRQRRGWTAVALAERCAQLGAPQITATVVTNLEASRPGGAGRRSRGVSVDELLVLAAALEVPPPYLLVPLAEDGMLEITPSLRVDSFGVAAWLCGEDLPQGLESDERSPAVFRRARRPLDLLRHVWLVMGTLRKMHDEGAAGSAEYAALVADLRERLEEIDGLGIVTPPFPPWLADDLAKAGA